jgi:hypothetical protein
MNYKNLITGEIISFTCYQKLPYIRQRDYFQVTDNPTHIVNEYNSDFMLYVLPSSTNYIMIEGLNDSSGGAYDGF